MVGRLTKVVLDTLTDAESRKLNGRVLEMLDNTGTIGEDRFDEMVLDVIDERPEPAEGYF
jgi:hypothetical protein